MSFPKRFRSYYIGLLLIFLTTAKQMNGGSRVAQVLFEPSPRCLRNK